MIERPLFNCFGHITREHPVVFLSRYCLKFPCTVLRGNVIVHVRRIHSPLN